MISSNNRLSYRENKTEQFDELIVNGFDYRNKQIKKSVSSYLLNVPMIRDFIEILEPMIYYMTEKSKKLMHFRNFAMKKRHTNFR
jgi:hypothetical protein